MRLPCIFTLVVAFLTGGIPVATAEEATPKPTPTIHLSKTESEWDVWQRVRDAEFERFRLEELRLLDHEIDSMIKKWTGFQERVQPDNPHSTRDNEYRLEVERRIDRLVERLRTGDFGIADPDTTPTPIPDAIKGLPKTGRSYNGRFIGPGDGTLLDTRHNLMWASSDNLEDINYEQAKAYVAAFNAGGFNDWRLPTVDDLMTLYRSGPGYQQVNNRQHMVDVTKFLLLTSCCPWTSEEKDGEVAYVNMSTGEVSFFAPNFRFFARVLPVREATAEEIAEISEKQQKDRGDRQ